MRQFYFPQIVWVSLFALSLSRCSKPADTPISYLDLLKQGVEVADSVRLIYSDSAFVRAIITAPILYQKTINRGLEQEFPNGVKAEFYDRGMILQSTLTSNYALRVEKEEKVYVRDHVVLTNIKGEKLETSELIWKEKESKITTEKAYRILREDGTVITGYGFTANESFTTFRSHSVQTRFKMRNQESSN